MGNVIWLFLTRFELALHVSQERIRYVQYVVLLNAAFLPFISLLVISYTGMHKCTWQGYYFFNLRGYNSLDQSWFFKLFHVMYSVV